MPESLLPSASTTRRGVDPSKFMGASFAAGSGLEERVENNEKKITSLKNIIKLRKVNVDKLLPASSDGEDKDQTIRTNNFADRLDNIAQSLGVLTRALKQQFNLDKKAADQFKRDADEAAKKDRERNLESRGAKFVGGVTNAITKPFKGFFQSLIDFFKNILLGAGILALIKWLRDEDNQAKIKAFWDFMTKRFPELIGKLLDTLKKTSERLQWLTNPIMKLWQFLVRKATDRWGLSRLWTKKKNGDDDDKKGGPPPPPSPKTVQDPSTVVQGALGGAQVQPVTPLIPGTEKREPRGSVEKENGGVNWGAVMDWALLGGALISPWDMGVAGDLSALANLLIKGRISWAAIAKIGGPKLVQELHKHFVRYNIPVPKPQFNLSSLAAPSAVRIASSNIKTNIGAPIASNETKVINMGDSGSGTVTASNPPGGGGEVPWFPSSVGNDGIASRSILSLVS